MNAPITRRIPTLGPCEYDSARVPPPGGHEPPHQRGYIRSSFQRAQVPPGPTQVDVPFAATCMGPQGGHTKARRASVWQQRPPSGSRVSFLVSPRIPGRLSSGVARAARCTAAVEKKARVRQNTPRRDVTTPCLRSYHSHASRYALLLPGIQHTFCWYPGGYQHSGATSAAPQPPPPPVTCTVRSRARSGSRGRRSSVVAAVGRRPSGSGERARARAWGRGEGRRERGGFELPPDVASVGNRAAASG